MSVYKVHAIKYASIPGRRSKDNFIGGDPHDRPMPMDFFVWAITGEDGRTFMVDTGFDEASGRERGWPVERPVQEGLKAIGVDAHSVKDVIISHMHWDHAGNHALFPNARFHVQEKELQYCTGKCMCHHRLRRPYAVGDVTRMVHRLYEGRVAFHDGSSEIADGLSVHLLGGHTLGMQCVRVRTRRGWLVLASDAAHYWDNVELDKPFPEFLDVAKLLDANKLMKSMADSPLHVIPGHDPLVLKRFPTPEHTVDVARLDADPIEA